MAKFHFVEDYERHVRGLMKSHPLDEAMSLAVGGGYEAIGAIECEIMCHAGLSEGARIVDFGCGSGRLAVQLAKTLHVEYLGLDVVRALLDYARSRCPPHYRFQLNHSRSIPVDDQSIDYFAVFSVFTHLLQTESYIYLQEMFRALKPGGRVVASFLELALEDHWRVFAGNVELERSSTVPHLNEFVERGQFEVFAKHLGFASVEFVAGNTAPWPSGAVLGQSLAIFHKGA